LHPILHVIPEGNPLLPFILRAPFIASLLFTMSGIDEAQAVLSSQRQASGKSFTRIEYRVSLLPVEQGLDKVISMSSEATPSSADLPLGFQWGAVKAGIKVSGKLDLAIAIAPGGANAAAMFTRNRVVAAPIIVGRKHLAATGGRVSAVLVNSGNANCMTGEAGIEACIQTCVAAAEEFHCIFDEVFPSSTGIIGVPFPVEKIVAALPSTLGEIGPSAAHAELFASAILTTDTRMKVARAIVGIDATHPDYAGMEFRIFGVAKGAGMIHPQLAAAMPPHATMLVYLFTDLDATPAELEPLLALAAEGSFNSISIDGDTSTNDTVLLLASGASGVKLDATSATRWPTRSSMTAKASPTSSTFTSPGPRPKPTPAGSPKRSPIHRSTRPPGPAAIPTGAACLRPQDTQVWTSTRTLSPSGLARISCSPTDCACPSSTRTLPIGQCWTANTPSGSIWVSALPRHDSSPATSPPSTCRSTLITQAKTPG
jgi:hypothetical protein